MPRPQNKGKADYESSFEGIEIISESDDEKHSGFDEFRQKGDESLGRRVSTFRRLGAL